MRDVYHVAILGLRSPLSLLLRFGKHFSNFVRPSDLNFGRRKNVVRGFYLRRMDCPFPLKSKRERPHCCGLEAGQIADICERPVYRLQIVGAASVRDSGHGEVPWIIPVALSRSPIAVGEYHVVG